MTDSNSGEAEEKPSLIQQFSPKLAKELGLPANRIQGTLELLLSDNTIPFIARYRKEATGGLDEVQIGQIQDRYQYLSDLEERRNVILNSIREQEKLTPELEKAIVDAESKQILEDLYLPYKPKRRTRATIARELGLEPLSELILKQDSNQEILNEWIVEFNQSREENIEEQKALQGAKDILAERISEDAELRKELRDLTSREGSLVSTVKPEFEGKSSKFEMYYAYEEKLSRIPPHRVLAMRRGEKDQVLKIQVKVAEAAVISLISKHWMKGRSPELRDLLLEIFDESYKRLLSGTIETDIRVDLKIQADTSSIDMFSKNLRQLMLQPPGGARNVLGLDPAFRTGTKWVLVNHTGRFVKHGVIYPVPPKNQVEEARKELNAVLKEHKVDIVAIGNGTASREVFRFIRDWIKDENHELETLVVNESGASVYSASKTAREEFPDLDLTVRGAVSIARRYQDPLAELVKIEPKSIGVGQYQHDVNQNRLKQSLERTVESCVNYVGVDLNRASFQLLEHVSGISPGLARNIVQHRNLNGAYSTRNDLLNVKGMGKRTFEQSAGFLRVMESENPLDQSAVHPENYTLVEQMAEHLELPLKEMVGNEEKLKLIDVKRYEEQGIGSFTLKDIIDELHKPGRDPRKDHETVQFDDSVSEIADLEKGMKLPGVITNVTHFGAFIDIGVHQDGLVHISRLSKKYIKDPLEVCTVGQKVDAWVLEVDEERKRISLSLNDPGFGVSKSEDSPKSEPGSKKKIKTEKKNKNKKTNTPKKGKEETPVRKSTGNFEEDMAALMEKFNQYS